MKAAVRRADSDVNQSEKVQRRAARGGEAQDKISRRAMWLNANVFQERPIDEEAMAAMRALGTARAMELFKDLEDNRQRVKNASGYLKSAAAREGHPRKAKARKSFFSSLFFRRRIRFRSGSLG